MAKVLTSLGKKHSKQFGVAPLGEIFKVDDAPFPKIPLPEKEFDEEGEEIEVELSDSAKALKLKIDEAKSQFTPQMIQKISHSILSLYCQTNFKSNELNQLLKTFDNTNQIGAANFTATNLKDALSQGRFWISTEECDGIFKFMDPMGTGKMGIKPFIELFNNEFLYAYTVKATVNNTVLLYAIFEGLEL